MHVLLLGLYAEGSTDERFLQPVIRRTAEELIAKYDTRNVWDEALINVIRVSPELYKDRAHRILAAAEEAQGCHILVVHADADGSAPERALAERFHPGLSLVAQAGQKVCQHLLPVIPIQEIEAWLLADKEALVKELKAVQGIKTPTIPPLQRIESLAQPKEHLDRIIREMNGSRGRKRDRKDLYEPLGEMVRLEKLAGLSAYRRFANDFKDALMNLGIISN